MNPTTPANSTATAPSPALATTLVRIAEKQAARYEALLDRPDTDSKVLHAECRMLVSVVRAAQSLQPRPSAARAASAPKPQHTHAQPAPKSAPQVPTDPKARFGAQPDEAIVTPPDAPGLTFEQRQARYSADLARATGFYKADELEAAARALGV